MIQLLFIVYMLVILCAAIMAIVYQDSLRTRKLGILAVYLSYTFLQEVGLRVADHYNLFASTAIVYDVYKVLNVAVFAFIYSRIPFLAPLRKLIIGLAALFILATLVQLLFPQTLTILPRYLPLARGLIITGYGMFFLSYYFRLDHRELEKYWTPVLWITIGIVVFYPVISISLAFQSELINFGDVYGIRLYQIIPQFMSLFMYSCFMYAFYLCKKKN